MDDDQFKKEFEKKVEARKLWLMEELKSGGKYLDVSAKKLDDLDALTIALYLHECPLQLQLFHIGANQITDRGLIDMLTGLQWHDQLKEIYVGNNLITDIGIQGLVEVLSLFKQLKILSMSNCSIDDSTFIQLCYTLPELTNLQQLQVPNNDIGDYGMICFSSLMATNSLSNLRILHFGGNQFTSKSLVPFFGAMKKNKTVKILYLNDIGIEMETIKAASNCLKKNKSLEELNLGNTGFSDAAARQLWPNIKYLKTLHLWNNHLTNQSIYDLMQSIEKDEISLTYVGLADNNIEDQEVIDEINMLLKSNEIDPKEQELDDEQEAKEMLDLAKVEEIEEKLGELELLQQNVQQEQVEPLEESQLQGKLKKWKGEQEDQFDKTFKHSNLE